MLINKVVKASEPLLGFIGFLANSWDKIEPIVLCIAVALGIYATALGIATAAPITPTESGMKRVLG